MKVNPRYYAKQIITEALKAPTRQGEIIERWWRQVLKNKHFSWRQRIIQEVNEVWHSLTGERQVLVATSRELNLREQKEIVNDLKKAIVEKFTVAWQVKPHLLGGIVITVDGERFDFSLKRRLDKLYYRLIN